MHRLTLLCTSGDKDPTDRERLATFRANFARHLITPLGLRVLGAALDWLAAGNKSTATRLLGATFDESGIRAGMERAYRDLARETTETWERIALVEKANAIRPRTRV